MAGTALVTGGGRRIGRAMAEYLARQGYDVAVHYATSAEGAAAVAAGIRQGGGRAAALGADLLEEEAAAGLVPRAAEALGAPLTLLVNNASVFENDDIRSASRESWDRHIGSNLRAPVVLTQAFAAQAPGAATDEAGEPQARAQVVNMLDQRVLTPPPDFMSYTLAKMGLWGFTRIAAQALAPDIRVNAIGPGPTMRGDRESEEHFARQRATTALGRGADAADITAALGYLLEARAVTGQLICVDGGQHLVRRAPVPVGRE